MVYVSATLSLALVEILVHIPSGVLPAYTAVAIDFDDSLVTALGASDLPPDWRTDPAPASTKAIGDAWVRTARGTVSRFQSVVVPDRVQLPAQSQPSRLCADPHWRTDALPVRPQTTRTGRRRGPKEPSDTCLRLLVAEDFPRPKHGQRLHPAFSKRLPLAMMGAPNDSPRSPPGLVRASRRSCHRLPPAAGVPPRRRHRMIPRPCLAVPLAFLLSSGALASAQDKPVAFVGARVIPIAGPEIDEGRSGGPSRQGRGGGSGRRHRRARRRRPARRRRQGRDARSRRHPQPHRRRWRAPTRARPSSPTCALLDSIDVRDARMQKARAGGITTVNVMPGSGHLLSRPDRLPEAARGQRPSTTCCIPTPRRAILRAG